MILIKSYASQVVCVFPFPPPPKTVWGGREGGKTDEQDDMGDEISVSSTPAPEI